MYPHKWMSYKYSCPNFMNIVEFNSSLPGQNLHHFTDDVLKCILMNQKFCIFIKISLKFVTPAPINKKHSIGLDYGLVPNRQQAIIWTNADPIHCYICVALGGDELSLMPLITSVISWKRLWSHVKTISSMCTLRNVEYHFANCITCIYTAVSGLSKIRSQNICSRAMLWIIFYDSS